MAPPSLSQSRDVPINYGSSKAATPSGSHTYQSMTTSESESLLAKELSLYEDASTKGRRNKFIRLAVIAVLAIAGYSCLSKIRGREKDYGSDSDNGDNYAPLPVDGKRPPFSRLHPVRDLGIGAFARPKDSRPSPVLTGGNDTDPNDRPTHFPTNAWYQNMLLAHGEPSDVNRVYTTPFLVDAIGPIPGLRVHAMQLSASTSVIQLSNVNANGLTVGAAPDAMIETFITTSNDNSTTANSSSARAPSYTKEYRVDRMTPLGLTLAWEKSFPMSSSIVKGMPYATMVYEASESEPSSGETWYPTVASEIRLASKPIVDGKFELTCLGGDSSSQSTTNVSNSTTNVTSTNATSRHLEEYHTIRVEREVELLFDSDFTWLVFVSRPVTMQCVVNPDTQAMQLQVVDTDVDVDEGAKLNTTDEEEPPFVIRIALSKPCTSNKNPIFCHHEQMLPYSLNLGQGRYDDLLRNHSHIIPGPDTSFDYGVDHAIQKINIVFDWDTRDMRNFNQRVTKATPEHDLIVFALPHHLDLMGTRYAPGYLKYCASTLIGPACLLSGSKWSMVESLPQINFRAPRPPAPWAIKALAKSAKTDIGFRLPKFYRRGAGDTYFSGKLLAKLARILVVVEELKEICGGPSMSNAYKEACHGVQLPSDREVKNAAAALRSSVEVWLNGKAVTPFVFDDAWGGVVSCGCNNPDGGDCRNKYPNCPAFTDPGLNFGNAFYNDLHFHYGYHIYAAAVMSHFDPDWGKKFFERVLLLVRNIANPSDNGDYFPAFRHKDWYQGHSWASGVVPPYLNGRNQESSSEAIAAYEAVALYGVVMQSVFETEAGAYVQKAQVALEVQRAGLILTATELRSTRRYYHVRDKSNANHALRVYPSEYNNHAIGMMWNTMAQYQTWFGGKPYLAAGIQLLPITPIAEQRDGLKWLTEMYPSYAKTCSANKDCEENGWSVLQLASLATIGHQMKAAEGAEALAPEVFVSAGGNGHSLTNTLWYISTRSIVNDPMNMTDSTTDDDEETTAATVGNATNKKHGKAAGDVHNEDIHVLSHCYRPKVCTDYILDTIADEYSCRQRMTWLLDTMGHTQEEACFTVAKIQFPEQCGACNPNGTKTSNVYIPQCPPCTVHQCESALNNCPQFRQTFVCTSGPNRGGCSRFPWDVRSTQCTGCCELSECAKKHGF